MLRLIISRELISFLITLLCIFFLQGCYQDEKIDRQFPLGEDKKISTDELKQEYGKAINIENILLESDFNEKIKDTVREQNGLNLNKNTLIIFFHGIKEESDNGGANQPLQRICTGLDLGTKYTLVCGNENVSDTYKDKHPDIKEYFTKLSDNKVKMEFLKCRCTKKRLTEQINDELINEIKTIIENKDNKNKRIVFLGWSAGGLVAAKAREKMITDKVPGASKIDIVTVASPLAGYNGNFARMDDLIKESENLKDMLAKIIDAKKIEIDIKSILNDYVIKNLKAAEDLNPQLYEPSEYEETIVLKKIKKCAEINGNMKISSLIHGIYSEKAYESKLYNNSIFQSNKTFMENFIKKMQSFDSDDFEKIFEGFQSNIKEEMLKVTNELMNSFFVPNRKFVLDLHKDACIDNHKLYNPRDLHIVARVDIEDVIKGYILHEIEAKELFGIEKKSDEEKAEMIKNAEKKKSKVIDILNQENIASQIKKIAAVHNEVLCGKDDLEGSDWMVSCSKQYYKENNVAYVYGPHLSILGSALSKQRILQWLKRTE